MKTYIGIKMIDAIEAVKNGQEGYSVIYPDGYTSWSPKDVFEASYLPIQLKNSLTQADIDSMLAQAQTSDADNKTTIVRAECLTGFSIYETSACVSPENYDQVKGTAMAIQKVNSKIWFAMGFILQWARYGLKNTPKTVDNDKGQ